MRAIDLYAGIGGWSLGLRLAGINVVASYEWWRPAIATHIGNHGASFEPVDIRKLDLNSLPAEIDLVVGSPPCTEFSYANRGGSGDLAEGLKDLVRFFEVVDRLKPRFWAMENVPRVADVLRNGFADPDHALWAFRHLAPQIEVIDFSEFGTPQARRRCIATNIPLNRVKAYRDSLPERTLGDVLKALSSPGTVVDPVWGVALGRGQVTEMQAEPALNGEELRMNREAKAYHPVYNNMAFPDPVGQAARTVTATCTRVSRESIVIEDPAAPGSYRRLTIRERACLQGFPITYQFHARSFAEKAKMIGNAIPPTLPYLLALGAQEVPVEKFGGYVAAGARLSLPEKVAAVTLPDREGRTYPSARGFRAALPGLRFKSGMRFELSNAFASGAAEWRVRFFFGSSTDIREIELDGDTTHDLERDDAVGSIFGTMRGTFLRAATVLARSDPRRLQEAWSHQHDGMGPYDVVDQLGDLAAELLARLTEDLDEPGTRAVADYVLAVAAGAGEAAKPIGEAKLGRNALPILSGLLVGEWFNTLDWHRERRVAA